MSRLNNKKKDEMREMYKSGNFTRPELARIFSVSPRTVNYTLSGIAKPFKYDAMNVAVSLDQLKEKGREIADYTCEPLTLLTKEPAYSKIVMCPQPDCRFHGPADRLLVHLIRKHHRFDLEYLLDG